MDKKKHRKKKKRAAKKSYTKWLIGGGCILCLFVLVFAIYVILQNLGKSSLERHGESMANVGNESALNEIRQDTEVSQYELEEGQILVDGQVYEYNQDIVTFLCMGIDSHSGISKTKTPGKAG